ncbi:TOMM precursor leader peptide-binding protein [Crossiella sp. CA198]|uniref:TOMM precursor leader peptide-binding protein n=1 Tax=Crossiella sp. CA198 TaxID=3455607 RepID=UPI003F8D7AFA
MTATLQPTAPAPAATSTDDPLSLVRPRILPCLPVLRRENNTVQLGLDRRHGVLLDRLSPDQVKTVLRLDGGHTVADLHELAPPEQVDQVLDLLTEAGLLDQPVGPGAGGRLRSDRATWALRTGSPPETLIALREHAAVQVRGRGRLATAIAGLLATAGVGHVQIETSGAVDVDDLGCGFTETDIGRPRAEAARAHLLRCAPSVRTEALTGRRRPDLVVLTDWHAPDAELLGRLMTDRVPHLAVRVSEGVGYVGPFVRAGRGACLQCVELHRGTADPHWPRVSAQLLWRTPPPELSCAQATAALAATQVLLALSWPESGRVPPPSWSAVLEIDPINASMGKEVLTPHPDCPCGAGSPHADYM